jgi:two-component system, sensor histidine kinase
VKCTPTGGSIRINHCIEGADAVLPVEDDGYGIAPKLLPRIFDLFVQDGLGIGLTLVRRLVELHRGTVSAFSEGPGRGSVFTVRLPKVSAPRSVQASLTTAHCDPVTRRVLVIEDNRDAREMFRAMLELAGHEVLEAEEGLSGLELLKARTLPSLTLDYPASTVTRSHAASAPSPTPTVCCWWR